MTYQRMGEPKLDCALSVLYGLRPHIACTCAHTHLGTSYRTGGLNIAPGNFLASSCAVLQFVSFTSRS